MSSFSELVPALLYWYRAAAPLILASCVKFRILGSLETFISMLPDKCYLKNVLYFKL